METQEERGRLMETDGGAKGAAGRRRRAASPQPGTRGPYQWGIPAAKARPPTPAAAARCGGPARRDAAPAQSPAFGSQGLAVVPTPPLLQGAPTQTHSSPLPALPDTANRGAWAGRGWEAGAPRVSLTLTASGCSRGAGTVCSAARRSARPGWVPAFLPRALRPQALPRPAPRPHLRTQVQLPGSTLRHLPPGQNRSPPEPDPGHSRHTASSLRFRNSRGWNSG